LLLLVGICFDKDGWDVGSGVGCKINQFDDSYNPDNNNNNNNNTNGNNNKH
jgi:hypothetical protein